MKLLHNYEIIYHTLYLLLALGTMKAAMLLMKEAKADVLEGVVVLELCDLKGREHIPVKVFALIPLSD